MICGEREKGSGGKTVGRMEMSNVGGGLFGGLMGGLMGERVGFIYRFLVRGGVIYG